MTVTATLLDGGLHPLVVHFPVALLLVTPIFLVLGVLLKADTGRAFRAAALLLMVLGTVGAFVSVATGEQAGEKVERAGGKDPLLEEHEELAEQARTVFAILTLAYVAVLLLPRFVPSLHPNLTSRLLPLLFLMFYLAGCALLANAAHHGGRLVHERGITAEWPVPLEAEPHDE